MKSQYTTFRMAPSIDSELVDILYKLQKKNKRWSRNCFINVALSNLINEFPKLDEDGQQELFDKYKSLLDGHGRLK